MSDPVSDRKIEANRLNAQKSTGPRTDAGKAISSQNAMKHALFCKNVVAPGEDPEEAWKFRHEMVRALNPHNILEMQLVEQVIHDEWRIKRVRAAEQRTYVKAEIDLHDLQFHFTNRRKRKELANNMLEQFQRYELRWRNSAYRAMKELRLMQEKGLHKYEPLSPYAGERINAENEARDAAEEGDLLKLAQAYEEARAAEKAAQAAVLKNEPTAKASEAEPSACAADEPALDATNRDIAAPAEPVNRPAIPNPPDSDARAA